MSIRLAIQKAYEGGYDIYPRGRLANDATARRPNNLFIDFGDNSELHVSALLIDPAFWQCLGVALHWPANKVWDEEDVSGNRLERSQAAWLYHQHRLIDHLAAGRDLKSFFEGLSWDAPTDAG